MGTVVITCGPRSVSRPLNAVERDAAFKHIEESLENAKEKAERAAGQQFLKLFRKMVAAHDTRNHAGRITISAGMGCATVDIDGEAVEWGPYSRTCREPTPLLQTLLEINASLDWDWACTLDGEALN
jgi:hypothetical protein